MNIENIKINLFQQCVSHIEQRIQNAKKGMDEAQTAANEQGKSSAGDKYETGRAMMQIERDKNATQLAQALNLKKVLHQINPSQKSDNVELGSLVFTNKGRFYIAVSIGKLIHQNQTYYAISLATPLGKQLRNLKKGDEFEFNQRKYQIQEVY